LYKGFVDPTSDVISRGVGGAAAGAVKGGTEGAVIGGLASAGAAAARMPPEPDVPPVAAPLDQTAAEDARLARKEASIAGSEKGAYMPSGSFVPPVEEPKQGAYLPDSATAPTPPTDTSTIDTAPTKTPYKPDIFVSTYSTPKSRAGGASTEVLGQALGTTTGLTASRGAGEIEGTGTGGQRKKVWNEESLKLKDALGV
jgi:cytoskeletal protein RodZ